MAAAKAAVEAQAEELEALKAIFMVKHRLPLRRYLMLSQDDFIPQESEGGFKLHISPVLGDPTENFVEANLVVRCACEMDAGRHRHSPSAGFIEITHAARLF